MYYASFSMTFRYIWACIKLHLADIALPGPTLTALFVTDRTFGKLSPCVIELHVSRSLRLVPFMAKAWMLSRE